MRAKLGGGGGGGCGKVVCIKHRKNDIGYNITLSIVYTGAKTAYPIGPITIRKSIGYNENPLEVVLGFTTGYLNLSYCVKLDDDYASQICSRSFIEVKNSSCRTLKEKAGLPGQFWQYRRKGGDST